MANRSKADRLREKGDIDGLVRMMRHTTDWIDGIAAAEALVLLGDESGMDYLLECLQDPDGEVRAVAIEILQDLDNPRGKQALQEIPLDSIYAITQDYTDIGLECGNCGNQIPTNAKVCPRCGIKLYGDKVGFVSRKASKVEKAKATIQSANYSSTGKGKTGGVPGEVVVVDFDMPFFSLVGLLVKIALASIPALLILGMLFGLLLLLFGGALVGWISQYSM